MRRRRSFLFAFVLLGLIIFSKALPAQAATTELFFSEYIEGTSNNKALEIYNGTGAAVDLNASGYNVQMYFNGSLSAGSTINLTGAIANGDVYVLAHSSADATILAQADQTNGSGWFNGDDAVVLRKGTTVIDVIGQIGFDPGAEWGTGLTSTADNTLVRKATVCQGDTNGSDTFDPATEWDGYATNTFSGLGSHTASCGTSGGTTLSIDDVSQNEGNAGTTSFNFTVSLSAPAGSGGVTFDIATADATATQPTDYVQKALTGQTIAQGDSTYTFTVDVNGDTTPEPDETFFVNVTNVVGATLADGQGQGTIVNDDLLKIHDVQGSGATSPFASSTVTVEGIVVASFQGANQLKGFFLQEEDADADADPATSEGIFVYCNTCPTAVAEGQRVQVTGSVSEFNGLTEITASSAPSVVVTDAGNHLAQATAASIDLPIVDDVDTFYEAREGMKVNFVDALSVSEYFELARYGQIVLTEGGRSFQFTETNAPDASGYAAHLDALARRKIILDDDNTAQQSFLALPDGSQYIYHPRAKGGFSVGAQGDDFFRGGDLVNNLTGVLDYGAAAWRVRPTNADPVAFTVTNPRPASPPNVTGAIKVVGMNLLNYFTTIDTTSGNTGPCGPNHDMDCRGADSAAELARQRERTSIVICSLNADVYGLVELENTTASDTITDLLDAVNARCGGTKPYAFVNTEGTLGTDAIRVEIIYRTGVLSPVGSPQVDLDPINNRPPTAQTFDVVNWSNPAYGKRFTVVVNHLKSKGCSGASGADADQGDGQGCYADHRTQQATRLLTWINNTVIPAANDSDVLLLGDFNSYGQETPITTLTSGGYTDIASARLTNSYSYLFNGELGHLDYAFANAALNAQVQNIGVWHINADEASVLDYNDEIKDTGEASFEEKPDGSALVPQRVVYEANSPYRASDHDPVIVGLFSPVPAATTLASFHAKYAPAKQRVTVKWTTANELGVVGFNVWRQVGKREWVKVNAQLIAPKYLSGVTGGKYSFADKKIGAGKTYRYKLEILFADRASEWSEVQRVVTK